MHIATCLLSSLVTDVPPPPFYLCFPSFVALSIITAQEAKTLRLSQAQAKELVTKLKLTLRRQRQRSRQRIPYRSPIRYLVERIERFRVREFLAFPKGGVGGPLEPWPLMRQTPAVA
jgi:hypothetical protein